MNKMLKQVQKMQSNMAKLQEELGKKTVEATAGGGMIKAVVTGDLEIVSMEIARDAIDPDDPEMLQDLVIACVNEALRKARNMVSDEMSKITGGLNLPGLM